MKITRKDYKTCVDILNQILKEVKTDSKLVGSQEVLLTSVIKMLESKIDRLTKKL